MKYATLDLETTGVDVVGDKIVQLAAVRTDGETLNLLINPGFSIPHDAMLVHGITDEMVAEKPKFKDCAEEIYEFLKGYDILGFNSNTFDVIMLSEEFARCNIHWPLNETKLLDALTLERKLTPHNLSATYKRYFGEAFANAHDALADVTATTQVFMEQLKQLAEVGIDIENIESILKFQDAGTNKIDLAGYIITDDNGGPIFSFGMHKHKAVKSQPGYVNWMLGSKFPSSTKQVLRDIMNN